MIIKNGTVFRDDFTFQKGDLSISGGRFSSEAVASDADILDADGYYVIPGLTDLHFHGNSGADFIDGNYEGLLKIARFMAQNGVTSFSPASLTLPEEILNKAFMNARRLRDEKPANASWIRGITMEGPFFNAAKKGAQNADYLKLPEYDFFKRLDDASDRMIRIACVAPELEGALEFISKVQKECTVSMAHTTANYDQATAGIDAGARHVTHLFNAMPPLHHRDPGVIGAAADHPEVKAELISDGIHIHPSVVRAAFKLFGPDRIVLVSDSMAACGMPNGEYVLGGQKVVVKDRKATLADGTIAGSATHLYDCMRLAISFGIKPEHAVQAATYNPAAVIRAEDDLGSITSGKWANFVICRSDWSLDSVYIAGRKVMS